MRKKKKIWLWVLIGLFLFFAFFAYISKFCKHYPREINLEHSPNYFGATFSAKYATDLGLDWRDVYRATIYDLGVKKMRLPAYWDEINPEAGVYNFNDLDEMVDLASQEDVEIIIVLGYRQPRWPECHIPPWVVLKERPERQEALLEAISEIVERYKDNPQIVAWQIENEAYFSAFGVCPSLDEEFLEKEVSLVKELDSRPIMITASGEMSNWRKEGDLGDIFGSTLYRVVYDHRWGFFNYFFAPGFYRTKAKLAKIDYQESSIIELQTEPWVPNGKIIYLSQSEIDKSMSVDQFKANLQFAINTRFKDVYVWGIEWWYWQKIYGSPEYWEIGKFIFDSTDSLEL